VIIAVVLILVIVRISRHRETDLANSGRFRVVKIIDGDTFMIASGDKVRLANIDTPEFGEPGFEEATVGLERLIAGKEVRVEFKDRTRDKYGRLVGYVYVDDTVFVGCRMIHQGLGYVYLLSRDEFERPEVGRLIAAQREALDKKLGLWAFEHEPEPYYVSTNGIRLHRPGCSYIRNIPADKLIRYDTREEAFRQGLSPCRGCRP